MEEAFFGLFRQIKKLENDNNSQKKKLMVVERERNRVYMYFLGVFGVGFLCIFIGLYVHVIYK